MPTGNSSPVAAGASATSDNMGTIVEPSIVNKGFFRAAVVLGTVAAAIVGGKFLPGVPAMSLHLAAAGTWLGVNVWTTFFAGITMFKNLPRQMFGKLQAKLFPLYFILTTACSAILLASTTLGPLSAVATPYVNNVLILGTVTSAANLFFVEPAATAVMFERYDLENGPNPGDKKEERAALTKKFGKFHGLSSLTNLGNLAASLAHCVWLATLMQGAF